MSVRRGFTKIVIMGLDNAGKTSILLMMKKETNLLTFLTLKPTIGLNQETYDENDGEFGVWDFGGQQQYRVANLRNLDKHLPGTNTFIYVIDVQDYARYKLALEYLEDIMREIMEMADITPEISIFFHKYDLKLDQIDEFKDIDKKVRTELIEEVKKIIPERYKLRVFRTTIYTVFDKMAMSL